MSEIFSVCLVKDGMNRLANAALADLKIRGGSSILPYSRGVAARMLRGYASDLQQASCMIVKSPERSCWARRSQE